jgi:hypothetical protein
VIYTLDPVPTMKIKWSWHGVQPAHEWLDEFTIPEHGWPLPRALLVALNNSIELSLKSVWVKGTRH